ncbi:uncharacterized protein LOC118644353 [Monomorium pharaonis]|uniref:uncharacterized protein LOC118644353 n=1 Tax=Monomorium pharaonis TaxID=307658 RepID=UPI00063F127F|nr:uncharacterized protein LOC118644353 [Monomorium pharaonis]
MKLFLPECTFDLLLEVLAVIFLVLMWFIKYITFSAVMGNIKQLRNHVQSNWSIIVNDQETAIMHKYATIGRQFTIAIGICVCFGCFGFTIIQYIPNILDIVKPLNESRPRLLLYQAHYFVKQQKYFYFVIIHDAVGVLISGITGIAAETFSLVNALHAFGMFKITSYRMKHMLSVDISQLSTAKSYIIFHDKIIAAVDTHRRALEFSDLLKASFGLSYLFMITAGLCTATISFFRLFRILTMQQEKMETIKLVCYIIFVFLFLIIGNFVGQEFINCDEHVYHMICNTKWYNAPLKIQKLIFFLIRKGTKSYKVDAAGLFSPCLEGLATALSLLLSFFTLLCSM